MKKMFLAIAFALGTVSMINAQEINGKFMADFSRLSSYLELTPRQMDKVYEINDLFRETQKGIRMQDELRPDERMMSALLINMKQMRDVLSEAQYRKYVTLLNVTNNNNRILSEMPLPDVYVAENK